MGHTMLLDIRNQPFDQVLDNYSGLCTKPVSYVWEQLRTNSPMRALVLAKMLQRDTGKPNFPTCMETQTDLTALFVFLYF